MSFGSLPKTISVHLASPAFCPGEALDGEVHLQFPAVLDDRFKEIHIKLHGSINVSITQKTDKFVDTKTEHSTIILKDKKTIWNRGTYPPPESHTLKIPFQFSLSDTLLPTCKHRAKDYGKRQEIVGEVSYHLEVVGTRGALHSKRRERTAFKILPPSIRGAQLQDRLTPTWTGDWRAVTRHINIPVGRRRQRTSRVEMQLMLPSIDVIPSSTYIPFNLTITSSSPRIIWDETSEYEFIEPPTKPLDVDFKLERIVRIQPPGQVLPAATTTNTILRLGGMGPGQVVLNGGPVAMEISERTWVPELHDPSQGSWRQETKFSSQFRLVCPTTLISELMRVEYRLYVRVNLSSTKKVLDCEVPVVVIAGSIVPSSPSFEEASPVTESPIEAPPPYFDEFAFLRRRYDSTPTTLPSAFRESDLELRARLAYATVGGAVLC